MYKLKTLQYFSVNSNRYKGPCKIHFNIKLIIYKLEDVLVGGLAQGWIAPLQKAEHNKSKDIVQLHWALENTSDLNFGWKVHIIQKVTIQMKSFSNWKAFKEFLKYK